MTDIAEFLAARLDDAQHAAEAAEALNASPWSHRDGVVVGSTFDRELDYDLWDVEGTTSGRLHMHSATAEHIARHDPARVLADVAAKRAIIANAEFGWSDDQGCDASWNAVVALAQVYASHPDFDPSWRAEAAV